MKNSVKYLASANTTCGFVNKFNYINVSKNAFTYILKGGPGTGKSTFIKRVGEYFENKNYFVEYFYCSSDSSSLDGVRINNFAIVDGTAPHVTEATIPQVKERIVNVGEFIGNSVRQNKRDIEKYLKIKSDCFKKAYLYLEGLGKIFEEESLTLKHNKNIKMLEETKLKLKNLAKKGKTRELFCSFINKDGYNSFYKDNNYKEKLVLEGNFIQNEKFFNNLTTFLQEKGTNFIKFKNIFLPTYTEAIFIEKQNLLIVSSDVYYKNFNEFKNKVLIKKLIKKIATNLNRAKINHKRVEEFYINSMNFNGVKGEEEKVIKEIELNIK